MKQSKLSSLALSLLAAVLLAGGWGVPRAAVAAAQDEEKSKEVKDLDTELAKQMETIDDSMKKLRRSLRKPESNPDSLKLIEAMEKAATKSKDMVPAKVAKMPEAERAKVVEAYKKDMEAFIKAVGEMKAAVQEGKNDKAQEVYKTLKTQEDKGHEKYTD
jgi:soluble cytochrome b562